MNIEKVLSDAGVDALLEVVDQESGVTTYALGIRGEISVIDLSKAFTKLMTYGFTGRLIPVDDIVFKSYKADNAHWRKVKVAFHTTRLHGRR